MDGFIKHPDLLFGERTVGCEAYEADPEASHENDGRSVISVILKMEAEKETRSLNSPESSNLVHRSLRGSEIADVQESLVKPRQGPTCDVPAEGQERWEGAESEGGAGQVEKERMSFGDASRKEGNRVLEGLTRRMSSRGRRRIRELLKDKKKKKGSVIEESGRKGEEGRS